MAADKLNLQVFAIKFNQHQRQIHWIVVAVLVLYLLALCADLIWRIVPEPQTLSQSFVGNGQDSLSARQSSQAAANIASLQNLHLFGKLTEPKQEQSPQIVEDAPETKLNLTLSGTVASDSPTLGAAIIEYQGVQKTYGVGEKIEGTNVSLRQVQRDRVIIRNGVRDETLMLQGIDFNQANQARQRQRSTMGPSNALQVTPKSDNKNDIVSAEGLSEEALSATQRLRNAPDSFIDFISVAPHRENNKTVGYRVSPGKEPALFDAVGLEIGDVITQINGLDVTSFEALNALRSSEAIELTLNRNSEVVTLYIELPGLDEF
jgi:general secretion pathway protein C